VPFNVGKVGQVAATRHPILIEDVAAQSEWVVRPEWAKREDIRSFAGHPLIFREKLLGVIAVFSRQPLGSQEFTWLGLFANQAALAISNACAEQTLQSSERNLRAIIDTIPTLAWCNLPDGPNEFLNKGWHEYTGISPEESHGWGWQVAFHPEDLPLLMEKWQKMLVSGESDEIEARLRRHDGVYRWFLIRARAHRDESGNIVRWYGTSTDIEDRKRAEQALRATERNLAAIVDTIPTTAWTTRPDGYCDFLNQGWLDYTGMTAEQAQGWGWVDAIHPDDRKRLVEDWQSCLASGTPVDTEARIRRFDGSHRWFLFRANPLRDESGNIVRWYGTNIDIEERKRAEETLRAREFTLRQIVDNIPGLVATTSGAGEVEVLNRQTLEYFGRTQEELRDWALIDAVHPEDLPRTIEARIKSIEQGRVYEIEHRCRRADGVYRWFQVRGLPMRNAEGAITAWYLLLTDIHDRKKAEQAVQSNERNLSLIINTMPTFAWSARPDGSVEFVNSRWLEYTGLSPKQALNWGWNAAIHPDDLNRLTDYWQSIMITGEPGEIEARLRRFDGEYRWFLIRANALRDESGTIVKWYGTNLDIEDRKRAEGALRQSEERARLMVDSIDGQIMTATPKGEVEFVNQQVLDYFGKSLDELKDWRANGAIHPDDLPRAMALWMHSVETGDPYHFDERLRRADGAYRWFRVRGRCLRDAQGHVGRWYVLLTDIDEGKRAEAQLKQTNLLLTASQRLSKTGSTITDLLADVHIWSEEMFRICEFDPTTKITLKTFREFIHHDDRQLFDALLARGMTGADLDFLYRIVTPRGVVKHVRGIARVMEHVAGRPLFIGALQDVTESIIAEEALNKARSELAHVARITTLNALTASIAHEINQPLASLITNASICLRRLNADPPNVDGARETVMRTIRDGNRAADVITRLRALYSKKEFTPEPLDLNEATREVIALSLSDLQRNNVVLRSELADGLPLVTGDRTQLQQVILNLVRNASDAMGSVDDRPRELLIRTEQEGADRVRLSVKDAGLGFTGEAADKLFQAFYTTKTDGMGIGLHVSQSIIEAHHGRLWAIANEGPGATFSFALPCRAEGSEDIQTRSDRADET
jgi:PAS domain S-box-containing protein